MFQLLHVCVVCMHSGWRGGGGAGVDNENLAFQRGLSAEEEYTHIFIEFLIKFDLHTENQ